MHQIILNDIKRRRSIELSGPSSFDELTGQQLVDIIRIRRKYKNEDLQAISIAVMLFNIGIDQEERLTVLQKLQLAKEIEFVFDIDNVQQPVKMDRWLYPVLPGLKLHGPADTLDNITFQELMFADRSLDKYRDTGNDQYLNELVAILMRPRRMLSFVKMLEDKRTPLNEATIKRRAERIGQAVDHNLRQAIRFNYVACRSQMASLFVNLFPVPDDDTGHTSKKAANESWLDVAINLARKEPGALGTLHDIEKDNAYLVLKVLDQVIKEHKERELAIQNQT